MRTIFYLIRKEFLQIKRHRIMIAMLLVMPFLQLIILAHAADFEIRNINLHVVDKDMSTLSRRLIQKFDASKYFNITSQSFSEREAHEEIKIGEADLFLSIGQNFENDLTKNGTARLTMSLNAIDGMKAGVSAGYAANIIQGFNKEIIIDYFNINMNDKKSLRIEPRFWYNPDMEYDIFMVPGILVILVTAIGMFLSGLNIVKEKELGTIEQINVTPIKKYEFIIGKLAPFLILGLLELALGLIIGKLIFNIPIEGSLWIVFGFAILYLVTVLGLGLFVSTITNTQQQSMFMSWFFLMIFVLMSGLFTPIESMPAWAQKITWFNPVAYFIDLNRKVLLKGSDFVAVQGHFIKIAIFALVVNVLAILSYRKSSI